MTESKYEELVSALTDTGVALRDVNGEYRSTYDIMSDLADKWDSLTSMQKSALATNIAGTRQQNVFYSLIEQFQEASGAMESMSKSAGTLDESYGKYLDSVQGKMSQLTATFEAFSQSLLSSSTVGTILSITQGLVSLLDVLSKIHLLLPLIIATITIWKGLNAASAVTKLTSKLLIQKGVTEQDITATQGLTNSQKMLMSQQIALAVESGILTEEQGEQLLIQTGLNGAMSAGIGASSGLSMSLRSLWTVIKANPLGLILTALTLVISAVQIVSDKIEQAKQEAYQANQELISENKTLLQQKNAFLTNAGVIEAYFKKTSLTSTEESNLQSAIDSVSTALGGKKIALDETKEKQQEYLQLLKDTAEEEKKAALTAARKSAQAAYSNLEDAAGEKVAATGDRVKSDVDNEIVASAAEMRKLGRASYDDMVEWYSKAQADAIERLSKEADRGLLEFRYHNNDAMAIGIADDLKDDTDALLEYYTLLVSIQDMMAEQDDTDNKTYDAITAAINQIKDEAKTAYEEMAQVLLLENSPSDGIKTYEEYTKYIDDFIDSSNQLADKSPEYIQALREQMYALGSEYPKTADDVTESNKKISQSFEQLFTASEFHDKVETYKKDLSTIASAINSLDDSSDGLSKSEIYDLIDKFPELAGKTDDLKNALIELRDSKLDSLGELFSDYMSSMESEDDKDSLQGLLDTLNGIAEVGSDSDVAKAIKTLTSENEKLNQTYDETSTTIDKLQGKYKALAPLIQKVREEADKYNSLTNGNMDYNNRPLVSPETVRAAGRDIDGEIATTLTETWTIGEGEALYTIEITPILEDGTVLTADALADYMDQLVTDSGIDGLLESDKSNLVINVQPGDYDEEYWDEYHEKVGEVKDTHWELIKQLQEMSGMSWDDLIAEYEKLEKAESDNADAAEQLAKNTSDLKVYQDLLEVISEGYDKITSDLEDAVSAYKTVSDAITEFNENGAVTASTLESLIGLSPEYLSLLVDEEGQLNLTSESYEKLVKAKLEDALISQVSSSFDYVLGLDAQKVAAYAAAEAYDAQTSSIYDLLTAKMKLAMQTALEQDAANDTDAYSKAILKTAESYVPLISLIEDYSISLEDENDLNDESTSSLKAQKDALEDTKDALEDQKDALEDQKDALEDAKDALEDYKTELSDAQSSINDLIDTVVDYIKYTKEAEKSDLEDKKDKAREAIEARKEAFDDLIEAEKDELQVKKDAADFEKTLREKENSVAKNALAASIASLDDSAAGRKAAKSAKDALSSSREDLRSELADHEYDLEIDRLEKLKAAKDEYYDNEAAKSDERYDAQIKKIEDYLADTRQIYLDACGMIENDTGDLYDKLWDYTYHNTTKTKAEFAHMWSQAKTALDTYGVAQLGVVGVMEYLQGEIYITETKIDGLEGEIEDLSTAIDGVSTAIDGVESSIDAVETKIDELSNTTLTNATQKINDVRQAYKDMIAEMQAEVDAESNKKWHFVWDGIDFWSTSKDQTKALQDIMAQLKGRWGWDDRAGGFVRNSMKYYARGTYSAEAGPAYVNEEGHEIRVLNKGDGILTAKITKSLATLGSDPVGVLADAGRQLLSQMGNADILHSLSSGVGKVYGLDTNNNQQISIVNKINGDVNPSTLKALEAAEERIVRKSIHDAMSQTLGLRRTSRVY